jgi:type I restriction enzyme M protein
VLFIDAKKIYNQIDRSHREFTDQQVEFISNIVRLYRKQEIEINKCSSNLMKECFPDIEYQDVSELCKVVDIKDIENNEWSLNPGRYVGVITNKEEDYEFYDRLNELYEILVQYNDKSSVLEDKIKNNLLKIMEQLNE